MKPNENGLERLIRIFIGLVMLVVAFVVDSGWRIILYLSGIILVITGLTGFCIIYELVGFSSIKKKKKSGEEDSEE